MRVLDPLYGCFSLPPEIAALVATPEVRRLSQVRLVNSLTPSLATLGELRRYSHTLGVVRLVLELPAATVRNAGDRRVLAAAALLHDVGTPPFAHLFEYHLRERGSGWSHERIIAAILHGNCAPENKATQLFAGRALSFLGALDRVKISREAVLSIVSQESPLSRLLFGRLDLDNLDNVGRMSWALGYGDSIAPLILSIAGGLGVTAGGTSLGVNARPAVLKWLAVRRWCYEVMATDPLTVSAQAVLSEAIGLALEDGGITGDDWFQSDEALLQCLGQHQSTKDLIHRQYLADLPQPLALVRVRGGMDDLGWRSRTDLLKSVTEAASRELRAPALLAYVYEDRGSFSRKCEFVDPASGETWSVGERSDSVFLYLFLRRRGQPTTAQRRRWLSSLVQSLGLDTERILLADPCWGLEERDHQRSLPITAPRD